MSDLLEETPKKELPHIIKDEGNKITIGFDLNDLAEAEAKDESSDKGEDIPMSEDDDYIPTQIVEEKPVPVKPKKAKKAPVQYKTDHYSMQF